MQAETPTVTFRHALRVYWEDTDAGGEVFHANHLKFFERASTEWLRTPGFAQQQMPQHDGVMAVVADTALRCRRDAELLAEGEIRIGCVAARSAASAGFRPCRLPAALLEKIQ
jgi:acyl-CoA thioester hydrolase